MDVFPPSHDPSRLPNLIEAVNTAVESTGYKVDRILEFPASAMSGEQELVIRLTRNVLNNEFTRGKVPWADGGGT